MTRTPDDAIGRALAQLAAGDHAEPRSWLGPHRRADDARWWLRVWRPDARAVECLRADGGRFPLAPMSVPGLFEGPVGEGEAPPAYRLDLRFPDGNRHECEDPYRFPGSVGEVDLYLFAEGTHRRLWDVLGARPMEMEGVSGVRFSVWAPRARRVSVVGDFCHWDGLRLPMHRVSPSGVFELFVPDATPGDFYKFEIKTDDGRLRLKCDPFGAAMEHPPGTASRIVRSGFEWSDGDWRKQRAASDPLREPLAIYEVHLGSWRRHPDGSVLGYRELAPLLVEHARRFGFTHLELLPITEHPFDGSWGYQVSGYFAPTARYGDPDDLRAFVDICHAAGIGVILDWVPAHFPKDDFALRHFDGQPLYEYADPRLGEHPDWGTLVFDFGRNEVRNFLIASALFWLDEYHLDGLRVDAVASMLYRDYSREPGDWIPNLHGGRENLEAVAFVRELNRAVREECPGCITVAEESTAWPGVSRPVDEGGLGFTFKWNLGWMHDTLQYFGRDPVHRRHHQDEITFASIYEYNEHFVMPLSHDEVVHGKRSLLGRMPGDAWQKFANLRLLFAYQYTRPGKKLLFMGSELAPWEEWDASRPLDWGLAQDPQRQGLARFLEDLGRLYLEHPCLWRGDPSPENFRWIDCTDHAQSILVSLRRWEDDELVIVQNLTPVPRTGYRIGLPAAGRWRTRLSSDDPGYGGSGHPRPDAVEAEPQAYHGEPCSAVLVLPPLTALVLAREDAG
ncbi:MAG: 1,4-alpha-glucan branching protein GlgB [Myxococcota bacterium]